MNMRFLKKLSKKKLKKYHAFTVKTKMTTVNILNILTYFTYVLYTQLDISIYGHLCICVFLIFLYKQLAISWLSVLLLHFSSLNFLPLLNPEPMLTLWSICLIVKVAKKNTMGGGGGTVQWREGTKSGKDLLLLLALCLGDHLVWKIEPGPAAGKSSALPAILPLQPRFCAFNI